MRRYSEISPYYSISTYYVRTLLQGALRNEYDVETLFTECAIPQSILKTDSPIASCREIRSDKVSRLIRMVWTIMDDEFMGFTDQPSKQGVFAIVAKQIINEQQLGEALSSACYLYNTIRNDIDMHFESDRLESRLIFTPLKPELDSSHFLVEFFLLIWHRFASWLVARRLPLQYATFNYPSPEHVAEYSQLFPCHCRFNEQRNAIVFDRSLMDLPLKQGSKELSVFLQHSPSDLLSKPDFQRTFSTEVMNTLVADDNSFNNIETLARTFNMSARNLRRRLKVEGTSFQKLKDKLRMEKASSLLRDSRKQVSEISLQLGFQEPAAFTRAFKSWTGLSPRAYRDKYS